VFQLRDQVRFSDGTPFDAETAKFSLDRVIAPGSINPQRTRLAALQAVDVLGPHTLQLRLARRSGGLLQSLAGSAFVMLAPGSVTTNAARPVGTGPFRFVAWRRGDSIELRRNPAYWGGPVPLGGLTFRFIADPTAAYAALMAGDIDLFSNYPAPESFAQFQRDARFSVFVGPSESETVLGLNNRRPPLDNLLVRRAISLALDRRAIIDGTMFGYGTPIGSHFPPTNPDYVDLTGRYPHDVAAAKALLKRCATRASWDSCGHPGSRMGTVAGRSIHASRLRHEHRRACRAPGL
jgi:ABC-type transport system substrate-binding protein